MGSCFGKINFTRKVKTASRSTQTDSQQEILEIGEISPEITRGEVSTEYIGSVTPCSYSPVYSGVTGPSNSEKRKSSAAYQVSQELSSSDRESPESRESSGGYGVNQFGYLSEDCSPAIEHSPGSLQDGITSLESTEVLARLRAEDSISVAAAFRQEQLSILEAAVRREHEEFERIVPRYLQIEAGFATVRRLTPVGVSPASSQPDVI
jgi:hypothetical protein